MRNKSTEGYHEIYGDVVTNEQLVLRIKAGENTAANMEELYKQNKGMINLWAKKYGHLAEIDDLIQEGFIGLCKAVDAWKPEGDTQFITYAVYWIRQSMLRYVDNSKSCVRIPVYNRQNIWKYEEIRQQYRKLYNRAPEDREVCGLMGINQRALEQIKKDAEFEKISSLDVPVGVDQDTSVGDLIDDPGSSVDQDLEDLQEQELKAVLWPMVDNLEELQPAVIRKRFQKNMTLKETGEALGITLEQVRNIQDKGLRKLRLPKHSDILRTFMYDEKIRCMGMHGIGAGTFNRTWTSATEKAAIKLLE